MDTVEQLKGTYFYHGHANVDKVELFWLIFIECTADHTGLSVETVATILSGQPLIPKPMVLGSKIARTSIALKVSRQILKKRFFPGKIRFNTYVGNGRVRNTGKMSSVVGRFVPVLGYAQAAVAFMLIASDIRRKYNLIVRPSDRIEWVAF